MLAKSRPEWNALHARALVTHKEGGRFSRIEFGTPQTGKFIATDWWSMFPNGAVMFESGWIIDGVLYQGKAKSPGGFWRCDEQEKYIKKEFESEVEHDDSHYEELTQAERFEKVWEGVA